MNCKCKVEQRRLTPGVFNLKQFLNGSETMVWELDNCVINEGTCDLKEYDAYLTLCVAGEIDEIMLTKRQTGDKLQLIWNVGEYATALTGYVKYQISFRSAMFGTLGVIADDPEANGVYSLVDTNAAGFARVFQQAENGYSIKWDAENGRWALYQADGATVVDYQTTANTEPHCGTWNNAAVGNNEAAAWISDEAVMYISDSIAADQKVTGNFPTILRQFWAKVIKAGVMLVNGKSGVVELSASDVGAAEEQHAHEIEDVNLLQKALDGKAATSHAHEISNISGLQAALNGKANASHAHKITDTEGLQNALDGKAPTEHGHTISNVTGLQSALDGKAAANHGHSDYLPLAGGTMRGTINFSGNAAQEIFVDSDGDLILGDGTTNGAVINLRGQNSAENQGGFYIRVKNGDNAAHLICYPDGRMTWDGKNVETVDSVGSNYIRYTSGLQICWDDRDLTNGGEVNYRGYGSYSWTFPKPFISPPVVSVNGVRNQTGESYEKSYPKKVTTTGVDFYVWVAEQTHIIAIGMWK